MENIYKNPFSEYNANVMDTQTILEYWCSPFSFVQFGLNEDEVFNDSNPIVFMGGRGTGKTMFLRYCSHNVQRTQHLKTSSKNKTFLNSAKGVGFYTRIDGPVLRSFEGYNVASNTWLIIFTHYFELQICKSYLNFIKDLISSNEIEDSDLSQALIESLSHLLSNDSKILKDLASINKFVDDRLNEVTQFRAQIPLKNVEFSPPIVYSSQHLIFGIPEILKSNISKFNNDFMFVIMIDEYENFLENQQRMINTLLKFVRNGITFRLGMRLEGFRTFATISTDDFIKEGRDYRSIVFEEVLIKDSGYSNYLKDIANKRLSKVKCFRDNDLLDITKFLGMKENLESEAKEIVGQKPDKIFEFYKITPIDIRLLLRNEENPLLQVLNCLWFKRGKTPNEINLAMKDYLSGVKNVNSDKYKMDYVDKYKLSLTFLLSTIYKKDKLYYSFNTFSYLSSGIVGHFIELCRRCFQYAEFENKNELMSQGNIPKKLQNNAARDLGESELQQSRRIEKYGNLLYVFTMKLGGIFREHHRDIEVKYPETNQFSVDKTLLVEPTKGAFEAAQRWSIIQRKSKAQQQSIGKKKNDIFTLNRIFSPLFQISYRTRGGYSEEFSVEDISNLMVEGKNVTSKLKKGNKKDIEDDITQQELDF